MPITIDLNIKPEKVRLAREAADSAYFKANQRLKQDMDSGRTPTQVEQDHVESLSIASAVLGMVWRAMPV